MTRPYTGIRDAPARGARPGTKQFQALMVYLFGMRSLGIYANRSVRGGSSLSVHATGRACDLGGSDDKIIRAINFLVDFADELHIEAVHDYGNRVIPGKYGAAWRCNRNAWKVYDRPTIGSPGAKWVHYEIAPDMADDPDLVDAAFTDILNRIVKALEGLK